MNPLVNAGDSFIVVPSQAQEVLRPQVHRHGLCPPGWKHAQSSSNAAELLASVAKMMAAGDGIGGRRDDQTVESLLGAVILTHPSDYPSLE